MFQCVYRTSWLIERVFGYARCMTPPPRDSADGPPVALSDQLRDLADVLEQSPADAPDETVRQLVLMLVVLIGRLEAELLGWMGVFDAKTVWAGDGSRTPGSWVGARSEVSTEAGRRDVRVGPACCASCPLVEAAYRSGVLGTAKARMLLDAFEQYPDLFAPQEAWLVDQVAGLTVAHAKVFLTKWLATAEATRDAEARERGEDPEHPDGVPPADPAEENTLLPVPDARRPVGRRPLARPGVRGGGGRRDRRGDRPPVPAGHLLERRRPLHGPTPCRVPPRTGHARCVGRHPPRRPPPLRLRPHRHPDPRRCPDRGLRGLPDPALRARRRHPHRPHHRRAAPVQRPRHLPPREAARRRLHRDPRHHRRPARRHRPAAQSTARARRRLRVPRLHRPLRLVRSPPPHPPRRPRTHPAAQPGPALLAPPPPRPRRRVDPLAPHRRAAAPVQTRRHPHPPHPPRPQAHPTHPRHPRRAHRTAPATTTTSREALPHQTRTPRTTTGRSARPPGAPGDPADGRPPPSTG